MGEEAKGGGVEHIENHSDPEKIDVMLKELSFPIAVPPRVTTGCEENRERRF